MKKLILLLALSVARAQAPIIQVAQFNLWVEHVRTWQEFVMIASGCPVESPANNAPECNLVDSRLDFKRFEVLRKQAKQIFELKENDGKK